MIITKHVFAFSPCSNHHLHTECCKHSIHGKADVEGHFLSAAATSHSSEESRTHWDLKISTLCEDLTLLYRSIHSEKLVFYWGFLKDFCFLPENIALSNTRKTFGTSLWSPSDVPRKKCGVVDLFLDIWERCFLAELLISST